MDGNQRLAALKARYHASLPGKSAELEEKWRVVETSGFASEALAKLNSCVHKLAGSTGMYGYRALAQSARSLDAALREARPEDAAWRKRIAQGVQAMRRELGNAQRTS